VIVSPKNSGVQRARSLSEYLDATLAIVDHEEIDGVRQEGYVIGNVAGKKCILVDNKPCEAQAYTSCAPFFIKTSAAVANV
jgi:ribose-phosphate pyrophosphokinase